MPRQIFFMHTPKCGGTSVEKALIDSNIDFISTRDIDLNLNNGNFRKIIESETDDWLVFGQTSDIRNGNDEDSTRLRELLINRLHNSSSQIILPAREPVQLIRSWLHDNKTRANKYILNKSASKTIAIEQKLKPIEKLKVKEYIKTLCKICDCSSIPKEGFKLDPIQEEENLIKYMKVIMGYEYKIPAWSHTLQLFYNRRFDIIKMIKSDRLLRLKIDKDVNSGRIFIYDSEHYSASCKEKLNILLSKEFTEFLISTRANISSDKVRIETKMLARFEEYYKKKFMCEYDIYKHAI